MVLFATRKNAGAEEAIVRVGWFDSGFNKNLAFCAKDKSTGEMTGALKDYLELVSKEMKNARIEFEAIAYPTAQEAIDAMKVGEVDCMSLYISLRQVWSLLLSF